MKSVLVVKDGGEVYGIGDDYALDFPEDEGFWGWYIWRMNDKKHFPTREEILGLDFAWISEIMFYETMAKWVSNDSPLMRVFQRTPGGGEVLVPLLDKNAPPPVRKAGRPGLQDQLRRPAGSSRPAARPLRPSHR